MISKCYILKILRDLDRYFTKSSSPKKSLYYSKLAVLELCGWIEESMDDIVLRCSIRSLKESSNIGQIREMVKTNYGFDYNRNFRKMLIQLLGTVDVEKLENLVDPLKKARLVATLGTLKVIRNSEAHTHLKRFTRLIDAPSLTLSRFFLVYDGLREYDSVIRKKLK